MASLGQWRGELIWGHRIVSIFAISLLDLEIVSGIILPFLRVKPSLVHLLLVGISAIFAHYSHSIEKRRGSSYITVAASWVAVVPLIFLIFK